MKASEFMTREFPAVNEETPVRDLVRLLYQSGSSGLPVVDEERRVIGFISERDVIQAALPGYFDLLQSESFWPEVEQFSKKLREMAQHPVRVYMVREVGKVYGDEDDLYVAEMMIQRGFKLIPVVDHKGVLLGVVRRIDLLKGLL
jgi:CBS domain-containing protein